MTSANDGITNSSRSCLHISSFQILLGKLHPYVSGTFFQSLKRPGIRKLHVYHQANVYIFVQTLLNILQISRRYLSWLEWLPGAPSGFSRRLKIGQILGFFKTDDLKIQFVRFEDLKTALFCHFLPLKSDFKTEDLKTAYLKSDD